mgnify:CR=1 FL=1
MEFTLCNDGCIRETKSNMKIGDLRKTKDGFYFYTVNTIPLFDHEIDYLWDQFENNREAFELPMIKGVDRDPIHIIEDIEMGYEVSHEDQRMMEEEYGPNWRENLFGGNEYGSSID